MGKLKFLVPCILFLTYNFSLGQKNGMVHGTVQDSISKKNLSFATIAVYEAKTNNLIEYQISNNDGFFSFRRLPVNKPLSFIFTFIGYKTDTIKRVIEEKFNIIDLGIIFLKPETKILQNVVLVTKRPPVLFRNDTIQFNTEHILLPPNSLVDDLLKELPGVFVDKDGTILFNGRRVEKIKLDGKDFFSNDIKIATQNLPAAIVDNIQISINKDSQEFDSDKSVNEIGNTVNLVLKKSAKKKWLGNIYAGLGTNERYDFGGIINKFNDSLQFNVISLMNNTNKTGYTFKNIQNYNFPNSSQGGSSLLKAASQSALPFFNNDNGVALSKGIGINLNFSPNKFKSFSVQYFYGTKKLETSLISNNWEYLNDTILTRNTVANQLNLANSHTLILSEHLKRKLSELNVKLNFSFFSSYMDGVVSTLSENSYLGLYSVSKGTPKNNIVYKELSQEISYSKISKKNKRRIISIASDVDFNLGEQKTNSIYTTFYINPFLDTVNLKQQKNQDIPDFKLHILSSYTEPIGKFLSLKFSSNFDYKDDKQSQTLFDLNDTMVNISKLHRSFITVNNLAAIVLNKKNKNITIGINVLDHRETYTTSTVAAENKYHLLLASPYFKLNFGNTSISYITNIEPVPIFYLNTIPDNSNPNSIVVGNSELKPAIFRKVGINYYKYDLKNKVNFNLSFGFNKIENDLINKRMITQQGIQVNKFVNSDGSQVAYTSFGFGKDIRNSNKYQYSINVRGGINYSRKEVRVNDISEFQNSISFNPNVSIAFTKAGLFSVKTDYQFRVNSTTYTNSLLKNPLSIDHDMFIYANIYLCRHILLESNFNFKLFKNTEFSDNKVKQILLNEVISWFLAKDKVQLKITAYDILNSNSNFSQYNHMNTFYITKFNVLNRFFLISCFYNINVIH